MREPLALKVAFGENPKTVYNERKETPMTRMATAAILRQALVDAQTYLAKMRLEDEGDRPTAIWARRRWPWRFRASSWSRRTRTARTTS